MTMELRHSKHRRGVLAVSVLVLSAGVAFAAERVVAPGKQPTTNAPPEVAAIGLTPQEIIAHQDRLHAWLMLEMPAGALERPVTVQLTDAEIAELTSTDPTDPGPLRVGFVKPVSPALDVSNLNPKLLNGHALRDSTGVLRKTDDGGFVWATSVTSEGAGGLRVHFTNFSLPDDVDMYVFSEEGEAYGPYQRTGPDGSGDFWSNTVMSETAIVLVRHFGPNGAADLGKMSFTISDVGHIGLLFFNAGGDGGVASFCTFNNPCVENTNCVNEATVNDAENAVAKMLWISGCCINTCSGGLIADTDTGSQIPYFLTANHCLSRDNQASNLEAFFKYQVSCGTTSCTGTFTDPPNSLISGKTLGATVKATGSDGDFTLLQLSQTPPAGSVLLGWNSSAIAFTNGAALHRISHPSGAPQAYSSHTVNTSKPQCQGWERGERIYSADNLGATEGGSSGSPVVNAAGEVVGQLSGCCGFNCGDECDTASNATVDGALAHYFPSVEPFLDPAGCTPSTEVCNDSLDNDCDTAVDCNDSDCTGDPACGGGECVNPGGLPVGSSCTADSQCCSNKCKGPPSGKTCR